MSIPGFANLGSSGFDANDGNLVLNDEAKDWVNAPNFGKRIDLLKGQGDDAFGNGTSEDTEVPSIVSDGIPPNKSDITRFYVANETVTSPAVKNYLYLAWERIADPTGTTNFDFELNQSTQISSNGKTPVRTAGDVLIKYDLANGGTNPVLGFHRWIAGGGSASALCEASSKFPCWGKVQTIAGTNFEASINLAEVDDPIDPNGGPNPAAPGTDPAVRRLSPRTFGEAAIDLLGAGILRQGDCTGFASAYLKSRSSDAFNSAIKDFAAPVNANINNCGALRVHKYIDIDESGTESITGNETSLSTLGGVLSGDLGGWSVTITGPNGFSCTGSTNSSGVLTSCLQAGNVPANLNALTPGNYTVTENANAGRTIGANASPFFNTDPGPAPKTPPASEQATVGVAGTTAVNLGNSCYATASFEVQGVPAGQSGLFARYTVNGGSAQEVNLAKDGATSNYKASVGSLRKGDVIAWRFGINRGAANEQTTSATGFSLGGYPSCSGSGSATFPTATINGSKFKDVNGNGVEDPSPTPTLNDGPLQGFEFELRAGSSGSGSVVGTSQRSAANGTFSFGSVAPGSYTVHEVNRPSGWQQTTPASNGHVNVTVNLGDISVTAAPFGNTPLSKVKVEFLPQAKLLNADGTPSATEATRATSISCTDPADPTADSVGSSTSSNALTTGNVQLNQSSITCVVTFEDP